MSDFRLTYASMFNPPEELHTRFEAALEKVKSTDLGKTHAMLIDNKDVFARHNFKVAPEDSYLSFFFGEDAPRP